MVGHSIGDYVAACEGGVFSLEDGLFLTAHRGRLVQSLPHGGSMAVVFSNRDEVAERISAYADEVSIAAHNGPESVVISGRTEMLSGLLTQFESAGIKTRPLEVSHAMHSPLLEPILEEFEELAGQITLGSPKIPLISSFDGKKLDDRIRKPSYWRNHLRNTVCFVDAIQTLASFSIDAAIEVGPGTTLCGMAGRMWDSEPIGWIPSLRAGREDLDVVGDGVAELFVRGVNVDWKSYFDSPKRKRIVLPTYPFESQSFWYDMSRRQDQHVSPLRSTTRMGHSLVGEQVLMAGDKTVFEQTLDRDHPGFLVDHCLDQVPVVPAAAYIEQALTVAQRLFDRKDSDSKTADANERLVNTHSLNSLTIDQPLVLTGDSQRAVQLHIGPDLRGERSFEVHSRPVHSQSGSVSKQQGDTAVSDSWTLHASGTLNANTPVSKPTVEVDRDDVLARMTYRIDGESFYQRIARCGLQYGPMFQVLSELHSGPGECLGQLTLPQSLQNELAEYVMHPAVLDGCLQSIAGIVIDPEDDAMTDLVLPTHAERVQVFTKIPPGPLWVHTRRTNDPEATDTFEADIVLSDNSGIRIAKISGARVQRVSKQGGTRSKKPEDLLYEIRWQPGPIESSTPSSNSANVGSVASRRWLVFADSNGLADQLTERLQQRGDTICLVGDDESLDVSSIDGSSDIAKCLINPVIQEDYDQLLDALAVQSKGPLSIVDLRGVASDETAVADSDQAELAGSICSSGLMMLRSLAKTSSIRLDHTVMVTRGANSVVDDDLVSPSQTSLWGMGRTAMVEMPHLSIRFVDLDPSKPSASSLGRLVTELIQSSDKDTEDHVAFRDDDRYVARLESAADQLKSDDQQSRQSLPSSDRFALRLGDSPSFDELHYEPVGAKTLGDNEVEIAVKSTGLNFSDVLKALALYPGIKDEIVPLGIECAGVVSRIGKEVDRFQIGQRVMGVSPYSFASHTTTADYAIVATPDNLSDDDAATIPITFLTAHHALCTLARLGKGERVLIHAGAGGVGLAAIQIAQAVGAEIFATAGSDTKRDYLRSLGVHHVMDSRSLDFADEILEITSGYGVDVVLNSLPGEAITKSISILAAYGRFLEIGKTDIYQNRRIGLLPFQG